MREIILRGHSRDSERPGDPGEYRPLSRRGSGPGGRLAPRGTRTGRVRPRTDRQEHQGGQDLKLPICQDTGYFTVFLEFGPGVLLPPGTGAAVNEGVARATAAAHLRASVVEDPSLPSRQHRGQHPRPAPPGTGGRRGPSAHHGHAQGGRQRERHPTGHAPAHGGDGRDHQPGGRACQEQGLSPALRWWWG